MKVENNKMAELMYYMRERESIRLKKEAGEPWPWTGDKILQTYKFTNVKRAHDRTTRAFVKFYREHYDKSDLLRNEVLLYNCAVARYVGTMEFQRQVGWLPHHDGRRICSTIARMRKRGEKAFTGAYIITSAGTAGPKERVVAGYLAGLWKRAANVVVAIGGDRSWEAGYNVMTTLPGFKGSGFMTKEVLQDFLLITDLPVNDADSWTPMGPGARRGINRLLKRPKDHRQPEKKFIEEVQELHKLLKGWWSDTYPKSGALTAHDVQFVLCEYDKWQRVLKKQGKPKNKYHYRGSHENLHTDEGQGGQTVDAGPPPTELAGEDVPRVPKGRSQAARRRGGNRAVV